jgi:hypothetical protein
MIFTSPLVAGFVVAVCASAGGAIVGLVITGLGAAGLVVRRVRFRLVCASPSIKQKVRMRQRLMKILV